MDVHKTPQPSRYRISKAIAKSDRPQPWTASRCHRLLRPLLSRLALLRKELASLPDPAAAAAVAVATDLATTKDGRRKSGGKRESSDCQWMLPRKKMRHTYAQQQKPAERQTSSSVSGGSFSETTQQPLSIKLRAARELQVADDDLPVPGEVVAFTPLVRRARGQEIPSPANVSQFRNSWGSSSSQARRKKPGASKRGELEERLASLKSQVSASRYSDYESIFRSLDALLKGTAQEQEKTKGASSLLDMCLKKMPWYIAGVQAWELDEAEQNGTKSAFNSSDTSLQQMASPLCGEAMLEGLLNDYFCLLVIDLCTEYEAVAEAEALIEVLIQCQYPCPSGPDAAFAENDTLRPLSFLWDFSVGFTQHSFLLRQYTTLLANGFLPVEWLVTGCFERVWGLAHRVLSRGSKALAAIDFLVTAIISLSRHHRVSQKTEAQSQFDLHIIPTISRSLAILSAMNVVGEMATRVGELQPVTLQQNIAFISQNITYTLFGCLMEVEGRKRRSSNMTKDLLYLAAFLASSPSLRTERVHCRLTSAFELSLGDVSNHDSVQHCSSMISLISQIAQICGRGSSEAPYQHLERLCHDLQLLGLDENMMNSITRAGALFLAQQTSNLRDLVYAESLVSAHHQQLEEAFTADEVHKRKQQAATTTDLLLGYRWEETIGEWVAASPVAERRKQAQHRRSGRFQQSTSTARKATSRDTSPLHSTTTTRPASPSVHTELVPDLFTNSDEEEEMDSHDGKAGNERRGRIPDEESQRGRRHQTLQPKKQCNLLKPTSSNRRCSMRPTAKTTTAAGTGYDDELAWAGDEKESFEAQTAAATTTTARSKAKAKAVAVRRHYKTSSSGGGSSSNRRPLGEKRRVRLSGDLIIHSDDELGI
ncbi:hypothetical protein PG993_013104 [Apiospora rasikravindrae]|uniref:Wings apart-like protein C-terminal domain-containing protein n=1 Tax=Apiospora rasikravindrae TaxID=990691 RepID=A0ABR1RWP3_9PEZI